MGCQIKLKDVIFPDTNTIQ